MAENQNSSITRVRPFFQALCQLDPTGERWLHSILKACGAESVLGSAIVEDPGRLKRGLLEPRPYADSVLRRFGLDSVDLPMCFEYSLPPPTRFLEWLIRNPDQLTWPTRNGRELSYEPDTQLWREALMKRRSAADAEAARTKALAELSAKGSAGSKRKWWAFEGFTEVDCYLETDRLVLLVEGKRNEPLSSATNWYPARNQLLRNVEVAAEVSSEKEYAVVLALEDPTAVLPGPDAVKASFPHLDDPIREVLAHRCLGPVTWRVLCEATGVAFESLPHTTRDAAIEIGAPEG